KLFARLWEGLTEIKGVTCYGPPPGRERTPTVSFVISDISSTDAATSLAKDGIFASNGNFYATGVIEKYGHAKEGVVRAGCACYTTEEEVERLLEGVRRIARRSGS